MLSIKNITKSYDGKINAVDNLCLELKPGEIFGFLGPNGAGKTTTIKMLTGILNYSVGSVSINGFDLKTQTLQAKRSFGYVPDSHIVYERLTGREYVNFLADIYGVSLNDRTLRAEKLLKLFELTAAFDAPINTYSHGMKQKISIIGALIHRPSLWVLDEPMVGLDPQSAFNLKNLMREHCADGKTVFFSTHVLDVAEKICDRVGIIVKGKLVLCGSIEQLKKAQSDASLEQIFLSLAKNTLTDQTNQPNGNIGGVGTLGGGTNV